MLADTESKYADTTRPLISVNPISGREAFYFGFPGATSLVEFPDLTIEALLDELLETQQIYKHNWAKGDIVIWDNVAVLHRSAGDHEGKRLLWRVVCR